MLRYMNPIASHQPVLFEAIKKTSGSILELGAGDYSTEIIHKMAGDRMIFTIDDHIEWIDNFRHLESDTHSFQHLSNDLFTFIGLDWSVVLVDLYTWEQRMWAIEKLKDTADFVVIHDAEGKNLGRFFKYFREYAVSDYPQHPYTLLGSNKYPVDDFQVEGTYIVKQSV